MTSEARFEAKEGWVAVSPDGTMWRHRARGSAGVLVFERADGGRTLYQTTHLDCFSVDTTLTTESWREAVRFAVEGPAGSILDGAGERPRGVEGRAPLDEVNGPDTGDREAQPLACPPDRQPAQEAPGTAVLDGQLHGEASGSGATSLSGPNESLEGADADATATIDILEALPNLPLTDRQRILARLLQLEASDRAGRATLQPRASTGIASGPDAASPRSIPFDGAMMSIPQ